VEFFAQFGGAAYCIVALIIGIRLVLLSRRTRRLPELLVGLGVLLLAGVGYPLSVVAREVPGLSDAMRGAIGVAAGLVSVVGVTANTGFIWVLFRKGVAWADALFAAVGLGAAGLFLAQTLLGDWVAGNLFWSWLPLLITVSFGWAFVECGHYHLALRRRMRLGLADATVTDRFRLYAVGTGLAVVTNLSGWVFWYREIEMPTNPIGGFLLFALGTSSSACMLLAFLPPRAYLAWVSRRNPEAA